MQFFPANSIITDANGLINAASSLIQNNYSGQGFNQVLASFIEEDRYDYSGRPAGFAAYGAESGTIGNDTAARIAEELRRRQVSEISVGRIETLAASGSPLTIGTLYNALSGNGRLTEDLSDEEYESFKLALTKLGFTKLESEEMLGLSADGDTKGMWRMISGKLQSLEGTANLDKKEWSALLRGLDASAVNRKDLLKLFSGTDNGELEVHELSAAKLEELLSTVRGEYAQREQAAAYARTQARAAIVASLEAARTEQNNAPVEDARGSRRLEQKEALMLNSARKNTGADQIKDSDESGSPSDKQGFEDKEGKSRSERILSTHADYNAAARGEETGKAKTGHGVEKLLHNVQVAPDAQRTESMPASQAQNLNTTAGNHRQEIFSQVEQGILSGAHNGSSRLTLQLNPVELGQVTVILSMHQGEVKAIIRAEQQESAAVLREQMAELKTALEAEGIKVKELDVRTGLDENLSAGQWDGHQGHNLMRDSEQRDRMMRLARLRRSAAGQAGQEGSQQSGAVTANLETGLHIVA